MSYDEFQQLARLFVIGALDKDEADQFSIGRKVFGQRAEAFINECRKLNSIFALSLRPCDPDPRTKEKLLARIRNAPRPAKAPPDRQDGTSSSPTSECNPVRPGLVVLEGRFLGRN